MKTRPADIRRNSKAVMKEAMPIDNEAMHR